MKRIICYGDSNTWGYVPGTGNRFGPDTRWTALLQKKLGNNYCVIEAGINARTTSFDDPFCDYLNGRKGLLYALLAAKPIDLLIISLGTNDLKFTDAQGSSKGLDALLNVAFSADYVHSDGKSVTVFKNLPLVVVISPIALLSGIDTQEPLSSMKGKYSESLRFKEYYYPVCQAHGAFFLDAAAYAMASVLDCIHMDAQSHKSLSVAVFNIVRRVLK